MEPPTYPSPYAPATGPWDASAGRYPSQQYVNGGRIPPPPGSTVYTPVPSYGVSCRPFLPALLLKLSLLVKSKDSAAVKLPVSNVIYRSSIAPNVQPAYPPPHYADALYHSAVPPYHCHLSILLRLLQMCPGPQVHQHHRLQNNQRMQTMGSLCRRQSDLDHYNCDMNQKKGLVFIHHILFGILVDNADCSIGYF